MIHEVKTKPAYFNASALGVKTFEVRKNDRTYNIGDYLALNEWDGTCYTGRSLLSEIVCILSSAEYCKDGYVILGLKHRILFNK